MAAMGLEEATEALSKPLKDITDNELMGLLTIPEAFFPTNPRGFTNKGLVEEHDRRKDASKISYEEILSDVMRISLLRLLVSTGPKIYPELDLLGWDELYEEVRRSEKKVQAKIKKYQGQ